MGPRAALAVAVALSLVGCAAFDDTANNATDMAASAHDMRPAADMGKFCSLITITAPNDPRTGKYYAPALLTATVDAIGAVGPTWTVQRTGDPQVYTPTPTDSSKLTVQFYAPTPGTWTFFVSFTGAGGGGCAPTQSIDLLNRTGVRVSYRLRALPPESTGFQLSDTSIDLYGGTPISQDLQLASGTTINNTLLGPSGGTAGQLRFLADFGPDGVVTTDGSGHFAVALLDSARYQPLLIPTSTSLAPHLGAAGQMVSALGSATLAVGAGETVSGSVGDGTNPLGNINVVLRSGPLPSGPGVSAADGTFALHAEAGNYTLSFGSDVWPQATLANVTVPSGGVTVAVQYTGARVAVGGKVVGSSGMPVAGARVTIRSHALGPVANVTVGGGAPTVAQGRVERVVSSDLAGNLPAMLLPADSYDLIVEPPSSGSDGLTAIAQTVSGATSWTLALQPTITLAGVIRGGAGQPVVGARVTAVETAGLGAAPSTTSDGNGHYALVVDRGAPVALLVEPGAADKLSGATMLLGAGTTNADVTLGPGLLVAGVVRAPKNSAPVPRVRVEALCGGCGSSTPLASAISNDSGVYNIYLPDPGDIIVDGGTD